MKTLLVTPTGDRPLQFRWIERLVKPILNADITWMVIDDGVTPSEASDAYYLRRERSEGEAEHTLPHQLDFAMAHIEMLKWDNLLFIEDDDHYLLERHIDLMSALLPTCDVAGVANCRYYKVASRKWCYVQNLKHTALASTGISRSALPALRSEVEHRVRIKDPYIDMGLWTNQSLIHTTVISDCHYHIGFKNYNNGRKSNTEGHQENNHKWKMDRGHATLKEWLGQDYMPWMEHHGLTELPI